LSNKLFVTDVNRSANKLDLLKDELLERNTFRRLAKRTREIIWRRVKRGLGSKGEKSYRLAPLEENTISIREGTGIMRTFKTGGGKRTVFIEGPDGRPPKTGKFFGETRSNLTFSGQMLDSIDFKINGLGFTLFIPDTKRTPYKNHSLFNKKSVPTNAEVAIFVQAGRTSPTKSIPRPFFELTKGEQRIIIKAYNDDFKRAIRRLKL